MEWALAMVLGAVMFLGFTTWLVDWLSAKEQSEAHTLDRSNRELDRASSIMDRVDAFLRDVEPR